MHWFQLELVAVGEGGREGFHLAPEGVFDVEFVFQFGPGGLVLLGVDDGRFVFLPGADQFFQGGVGLVVESFRLVAEGLPWAS